ncbi:hypothetical protein [Rhodopirellula sp. MGV]|uniref:hypothetical protein n=1 Tax=Rhodopirellula sp. MGV TaxID=2023130 RepID=UPI000B97A010|nr:hypothetical protein [Rhodopirellula sp. MGV]OYP35450.1 hypothetical protein CGZ80_11450 [Rhodopirellula sp. MGV]PNY33890.1 hypothetical protein C2E31_26075 [Rhodopirellula baltica]
MPSTADSNETIQPASSEFVTIDRRSPGAERRSGNPDATDVGAMTNPRRKKQRRRHIDPTTCERDYSNPEIEFMRAMDDYKRRSGRMFPTCSEVLEVIKELGYYKLNDDQIDALGLDECDEDALEFEEAWEEQDSAE